MWSCFLKCVGSISVALPWSLNKLLSYVMKEMYVTSHWITTLWRQTCVEASENAGGAVPEVGGPEPRLLRGVDSLYWSFPGPPGSSSGLLSTLPGTCFCQGWPWWLPPSRPWPRSLSLLSDAAGMHLVICGRFNGAVTCSNYIASSVKVIIGYWILKYVVMAEFMLYPSIFLVRLRKLFSKNLDQGSLSACWDFNLGPPEFEGGVVTTFQWCAPWEFSPLKASCDLWCQHTNNVIRW